jgi:GNAT superfamily N-acetyltransferase
VGLSEPSSAVAWLNAALAGALPAERITVRGEAGDDLDFSAALYALTRQAELATVDWTDAQKQAFCRQQFDAQHAHYRQHYPKAQLLMVERDGVPVGRLYFEQTGKELRLMEVTLVESARNQGIGGAISDTLLRHAHAVGIPMGLHVEPFNPARRLYERQGFREVELRGLYLYMVCQPQAAAHED